MDLAPRPWTLRPDVMALPARIKIKPIALFIALEVCEGTTLPRVADQKDSTDCQQSHIDMAKSHSCLLWPSKIRSISIWIFSRTGRQKVNHAIIATLMTKSCYTVTKNMFFP